MLDRATLDLLIHHRHLRGEIALQAIDYHSARNERVRGDRGNQQQNRQYKSNSDPELKPAEALSLLAVHRTGPSSEMRRGCCHRILLFLNQRFQSAVISYFFMTQLLRCCTPYTSLTFVNH